MNIAKLVNLIGEYEENLYNDIQHEFKMYFCIFIGPHTPWETNYMLFSYDKEILSSTALKLVEAGQWIVYPSDDPSNDKSFKHNKIFIYDTINYVIGHDNDCPITKTNYIVLADGHPIGKLSRVVAIDVEDISKENYKTSRYKKDGWKYRCHLILNYNNLGEELKDKIYVMRYHYIDNVPRWTKLPVDIP